MARRQKAEDRRRNALAAACLLIVATVAACQQDRPVVPLRENPARNWVPEGYRRLIDRYVEAAKLTPDQVAQLEVDWRRNPEELETLHTLLAYYNPFLGRRLFTVEPEKAIAIRRELILWLIEHHPEHEAFAPAP